MADGLFHSRKCALSTVPAQVTGAHADFPVLLTAANLPAEMFDADGAHPAQDGGGDIRFSSDSAGANLLPCDVVTFLTDDEPANGVAEIWLRLPNLRDSQSDTIYVWWHTPDNDIQPATTASNGRNAVWSAFERVYHLEEAANNAAGGYTDSAGHGDATGSSMDLANGIKIGASTQFDGSSDYVDTGYFPNSATTYVSSWFRWDDTGWGAMGAHDSNNHRFYLGRWPANGNIAVGLGSGSSVSTSFPAGIGTGEYVHMALVADDGTARVYVNGVERLSFSYSFSGGSTRPARIGARDLGTGQDTDTSIKGYQDEVRISEGFVPSADWIATEYANQNDPGAFFSVGVPEAAGGGTADLAGLSAGHAQQAGSAPLVQTHLLAMEEGVHALAGGPVSFGTALLSVLGTIHAQSVNGPFLGQGHLLRAGNGVHAHRTGPGSLAQCHFFRPAKAWQAEILVSQVVLASQPSAGAPPSRRHPVGVSDDTMCVPADGRSINGGRRTLSITSSA